ncbi:MAG TPA: Ig-like domain-containing protein [Nitrososphaera sp.]|jgi:hypothetical protein|nr:Ig-like domain-containing protein [Nitrososphaera sp.]
MREFRKRKTIVAFAAMFLLISAATSAVGTTYVYGSTDDSTRPWVRIISPSAHTIVATSTGAIKVVGVASDNQAGSGVKIVQVKVNGSRYTTASPVGPNDWSSWSVIINVQTSGIYRITARATDNAGNQAWNSIYVKVIIDSTPPSISISSPQGDATVPAEFLTVKGAAHDSETGIRMVRAKVDGGAYVYATPKAKGDWSSWTVSFSSFAEGKHTIYATAKDRAGNSKQSTVNVIAKAKNSTLDRTAPTVSASPLGGTFTGALSVSLAASEPATIYYTTDGSNPSTSSSAYVSPMAINSTSTLKYFAKDVAGNIGSVAIQVYTISSSANPSIAITNPASDSEVITNGGTITVKGIASDSDDGIRIVELRVDDGSYKAATPKAPGDWSSWSVSMPVYTGERRLVPRATDNAGNQAWNSINVTVMPESQPAPEPEPAPEPSFAELDQFGIAKLYPTATGTDNEYYTKTDASTVTEFRDNGRIDRLPSGFSKNADGSWNIPEGSTPRWVINGGWRNVEMTMQIRINSGALVQLYSNGEQHTNDLTGAWHGSANKMRVYADGRMGFIKELYHETGNSGYTNEIATRDNGDSITGRWVTVKYVGYNMNDNSQRKLEAYISPNNNNKFIKVAEYLDSGGWSASTRFENFMSYMNQNYPSYVPENRNSGQQLSRGEVVTWMGDWVSFRSDGADYDFKNVSVREIIAGSTPNSQFLTNTATMLAPLEKAYVELEHEHED